MFLWCLKCNILPTRDNLSSWLGTLGTCCMLCNNDVESPPHLLFNCHHAKALWFAACQGFKADSNCPSSSEAIVNLICNPLEAQCSSEDLQVISLHMAFTLEEIWATRNNVIFNNISIGMHCLVSNIYFKLREALLVLNGPSFPTFSPPSLAWTPFPLVGSRSMLTMSFLLQSLGQNHKSPTPFPGRS